MIRGIGDGDGSGGAARGSRRGGRGVAAVAAVDAVDAEQEQASRRWHHGSCGGDRARAREQASERRARAREFNTVQTCVRAASRHERRVCARPCGPRTRSRRALILRLVSMTKTSRHRAVAATAATTAAAAVRTQNAPASAAEHVAHFLLAPNLSTASARLSWLRRLEMAEIKFTGDRACEIKARLVVPN